MPHPERSFLRHLPPRGPPRRPPSLRTPWPTDDRGLTRAERRHLQQLLLANGYHIGEADGKIGPVARTAIADAERRFGMPPTGRAG